MRPRFVVPLFVGSLLACGEGIEFPLSPTGGSGGAGGSGGGAAGPSAGGSGGDGAGFGIGGGGAGASSGEGGAGGVDTSGCGDGLIQIGEVCDDGNSEPGDGCSADCATVEQDFACPTPGDPCVSTVECGDSVVTGTETCDDGDTTSGDGCSSACQVEPGWACGSPGQPCFAAQCGDGILSGNEDCEDGDAPPTSGDGCSDTCQREPGYVCDVPNQPCELTVCGDGVAEGDEPCDDGNDDIGDGCNPFCEVEPSCSVGPCSSNCGDGLILPADNEDCDDGNTTDGDGCSSTCQEEAGFSCEEQLSELPPVLEVPAAFRDFNSLPVAPAVRHPDFQIFTGSNATPGLVAPDLDMAGKPVYTGICEQGNLVGPCPFGAQTTSAANFAQWYEDVPGVNIKLVTKLALLQQPNGSYFFPDSTFFPLTGAGWVAGGQESAFNGNNFGFTSEIRTWFTFNGNESLNFSGDDDVWVFINGKLALDLGGLHPQVAGSFTLDVPTATNLGIVIGNVYEIALFHAERRTNQSNFNLTLNGFVTAKSTCESLCGDAIVVGDETCDDGLNDGSYGSCNPDCTLGPRCGDAIQQVPEEECDDGVNLSVYSFDGAPGCAPGCVLGAYCGDGSVQSLFGEQCDDGVNDGSYGGCNGNCSLGPRCGDGVVQAGEGEECDDGNTVGGDGCDATCQLEIAQ
jgi:fibro-slime domain-containing protein